MAKFLVLYLAPTSVLEGWMKTPEAERKAAEEKMQKEWQAWMQKNASSLDGLPAGAGKTKKVTSDGTRDTKNEVMLYGIVNADSHESAAKLFEGHPHLGIPQASIEIMQINLLQGMQGM